MHCAQKKSRRSDPRDQPERVTIAHASITVAARTVFFTIGGSGEIGHLDTAIFTRLLSKAPAPLTLDSFLCGPCRCISVIWSKCLQSAPRLENNGGGSNRSSARSYSLGLQSKESFLPARYGGAACSGFFYDFDRKLVANSLSRAFLCICFPGAGSIAVIWHQERVDAFRNYRPAGIGQHPASLKKRRFSREGLCRHLDFHSKSCGNRSTGRTSDNRP